MYTSAGQIGPSEILDKSEGYQMNRRDIIAFIFFQIFTAPCAAASTTDFSDRAAFNAVTTNASVIGFNGILPTGTLFENFNPFVVSGVSFTTSTPNTFVNVTAVNYPHSSLIP